MQNIIHAALLLGAALVAIPARAADPADPRAAVPLLHYRSAFTAAHKTGTGLNDWRAANQAVAAQSASSHTHPGASAAEAGVPVSGHNREEGRRDQGHGGHGQDAHRHHGQGHAIGRGKGAVHEHAH